MCKLNISKFESLGTSTINDRLFKQLAGPIVNFKFAGHFINIEMDFGNLLSAIDVSVRNISTLAVIIIISSFFYGALNIHLYALYKQTAE